MCWLRQCKRQMPSKAPQGNERGAMGSKNPPCILEPLLFSSRHGSKHPGFVLRPLSPYAIASLGVTCLDIRGNSRVKDKYGERSSQDHSGSHKDKFRQKTYRIIFTKGPLGEPLRAAHGHHGRRHRGAEPQEGVP